MKLKPAAASTPSHFRSPPPPRLPDFGLSETWEGREKPVFEVRVGRGPHLTRPCGLGGVLCVFFAWAPFFTKHAASVPPRVGSAATSERASFAPLAQTPEPAATPNPTLLLTLPQTLAGTPGYMSPEVRRPP